MIDVDVRLVVEGGDADDDAGTASAPCTAVGARTISASGQRRVRTLQMSWKTAPDGRGDDADAAREAGQRPLAGLVEEALLLELRLEALELGVEDADALRLHEVDIELEVAAHLV